MFASRTPQRSPRREPAASAVRAVSDLLARAILVVATLTLFTFVTVVASQACSSGTKPTADVTQIPQTAPQVVVSNGTVVKFVIKSTACCDRGSGHCHGLACAGSCCPACTAGVIVAGRTIARDLALHFDFLPLQPAMPSTELDAQFRPPRIVL